MELVGLNPSVGIGVVSNIGFSSAQLSSSGASVCSCSGLRRRNQFRSLSSSAQIGGNAVACSSSQPSLGTLKGSRIVCCATPPSSSASPQEEDVAAVEEKSEQFLADDGQIKDKPTKAFKSSWTAKDLEGNDYLYRLGKEADNLNITVGARAGMIDDLFVGKFLGVEADIVFKYRQKVTRQFAHLQGDYYIAPLFLEKVVTHVVKNYLAPSLETQVPLILGVWGGKGQGKSFQIELICKALDLEPVIMSAGEMESEWAGEPGKLIRDRYRTASQVVKNQGKMSALVINDLDAGLGRFENTQCTVNNQIVVGTLMNLCDNPTRVSIGQEWREADIVKRVPIIVTGNDFSTLWAPLIRDGRMDKFYWQPTREDIVNTVFRMYSKDGITIEEIGSIVDIFPNQALDFYGALRSRTYDKEVLKWANEIGIENLGRKLINKKRDEPLPVFIAPEQTLEKLIEAGESLVEEQNMVNNMRLSDVYMKKQTGPGVSLLG
ncbi:hypothetical protein MPTK1_2g04090 [Marchantia polymorpha subsp. ruderalis]|uniref:Ribulose bisphosphate carboxylase/oxygenase activase, chloroplastic n=1 Tax=Marchantia polymorpha TaxID=3197 RepID=A0A2R6X7L7_MARPO|nr:hypothetical protein MARPO_0031s0065 [Marchantia polymorpha]BBN01039.1 hypothetical protein Mp_2g04090 [Marchantia polymorpha subsp. ruderalis]|eukprot:PTQ42088.1 hypothetical protein MARPO_0031s0065 [Marchantia polymorpha]